MRKISTVIDLLQSFVPEDDILRIAQKYGYHETARKFDFIQLLHFWMISSTENWRGYRDAVRDLMTMKNSVSFIIPHCRNAHHWSLFKSIKSFSVSC